jgi:hypothetical protein
MAMANPYVTAVGIPVSCKTACAYCAGHYKTLKPLLAKEGVQSVLLQAFIGPEPAPKATLDKELVDMVQNYKGSHRLLFGIKSDKKPEASAVKKMFLILLAAKIMKYTTNHETKTDSKMVIHVYCKLAFDTADPSNLALNIDTYWSRIKLKLV